MTGGRAFAFSQNESIGAMLKSIISDFRTSYVLRYSAQGVPAAGWHDVVVSVPKHRTYTVHARKGYVAQ